MQHHVTDKFSSIGNVLLLAVVVLTFLVIPIIAGIVNASPAQVAQPKWEAVSIKRCGANVEGGRRSERGPSSPDRLRLDCQTAKSLIFWSYVQWANGHFNPLSLERLTGGPAWIDSELYQIDAKAELPQRLATLNGPMFQAILADRFKLKIHRETREIPVYELTLAKGINAQPFSYFVYLLSRQLDRDLIDKTGLKGLYDIRLRWNPLPTQSTDAVLDPPVLSTALEDQLGLKLESTRGPVEVLVIDSVQKPTEN